MAFDASQSTDPGREALTFQWDLNGDGVFDTAPTASAQITTRFAQPGTYLVRALVTDSKGSQSISDPIPIRVVPAGAQVSFVEPKVMVQSVPGTVSIPVARTGDLSTFLMVHYMTFDDTGKAGVNYVATSGDLTFLPGSATATLVISTLDNLSTMGDKSFGLTLSGPTGLTTLGTLSTSIVTIIDSRPTNVQFTTQTAGVVEGKSLTLTIMRSGSTDGATTVRYATVRGSARPKSDYLASEGLLTFLPGESVKTIRIYTIDDHNRDKDKWFRIILKAPTGARLGSNGSELVTVIEPRPGRIPLRSTKPNAPR